MKTETQRPAALNAKQRRATMRYLTGLFVAALTAAIALLARSGRI